MARRRRLLNRYEHELAVAERAGAPADVIEKLNRRVNRAIVRLSEEEMRLLTPGAVNRAIVRLSEEEMRLLTPGAKLEF